MDIGMSLIKIGIVFEGDLSLGTIIMALHFDKFIVNLLAVDHSSVLCSNLFALAFSLSRLISFITRQVSSGYFFVLSLELVSYCSCH